MTYTPYNGIHETPEQKALFQAFIDGKTIESRLRAEKIPEGLEVDVVWEEDIQPTWYWDDYEYRIAE